MTPASTRTSFRDLPLRWRLQFPFLALLLAVGLLGGLIIVKNVGAQARAGLDADVSRAFLNTRARLHDRELYLLETANFAANLQGMADAVAVGDNTGAAHLLQSVQALKTDVELLVATNAAGSGVSELIRPVGATTGSVGVASAWADQPFVRAALQSATGDKTSGLLPLGSTTYLVIAAPICSTPDGCHPAGVALAGMSLRAIAVTARSSTAGVGIFDQSGRALGVTGLLPRTVVAQRGGEGQLERQSIRVRGTRLAVVHGSLTVQSRPVAQLAVTIRSASAFASVRSTGLGLALVLVLAMAGIIGVGVLISRGLVAELRALMATNRALGSGELSARAPVMSGGELGELASGLNRMAEQLQANVETLELRVSERTEEIRRLLASRTEFFAGLSHELRTPIAAILTQADLLAAGEKSGLEAGPVLQGSGRQLLRVVNEILELAKAEAARLEVTLADVRVADVVRELKPTFAALAAQADVRLTTKVPRSLPTVQADPARLGEVLLNLVDNAVKYTPAGGRVQVTAAAYNGHVTLAVADTGVGIPPEVGSHIFEPFFRVKGTEAQRGQDASGLGLAITKRLVEAQGGTINFESNGHGTTFRVALLVSSGSNGARDLTPA